MDDDILEVPHVSFRYLNIQKELTRYKEPILDFVKIIQDVTAKMDLENSGSFKINAQRTHHTIFFVNCILYRTMETTKKMMNLKVDDDELWRKIGENLIQIYKLFNIDLIKDRRNLLSLFVSFSRKIFILVGKSNIEDKDHGMILRQISVNCLERCMQNCIKLFNGITFLLWQTFFNDCLKKDIKIKAILKRWKKMSFEDMDDEEIDIQLKLRLYSHQYCVVCLSQLERSRPEVTTQGAAAQSHTDDWCTCHFCFECFTELYSDIVSGPHADVCVSCQRHLAVKSRRLGDDTSGVVVSQGDPQIYNLLRLLNNLFNNDVNIARFFTGTQKLNRIGYVPPGLIQDTENMLSDLLTIKDDLNENLTRLYIASCIYRICLILFNYTNIDIDDYLMAYFIDPSKYLEVGPPVSLRWSSLMRLADCYCIMCDLDVGETDKDDISLDKVRTSAHMQAKQMRHSAHYCVHKICDRCRAATAAGNGALMACPFECGPGKATVCVGCFSFYRVRLDLISCPSQMQHSHLYGICKLCIRNIKAQFRVSLTLHVYRVFPIAYSHFVHLYSHFKKQVLTQVRSGNQQSVQHLAWVQRIIAALPCLTPMECALMVRRPLERQWLCGCLTTIHTIGQLARTFENYVNMTSCNPEIDDRYIQLTDVILHTMLYMRTHDPSGPPDGFFAIKIFLIFFLMASLLAILSFFAQRLLH